MGASKNWLKSIVSKKKSTQPNDADSEPTTLKKPRRWRLLKPSHVSHEGSIVGGNDGNENENIGRISGIWQTKVARVVINQAHREEWAAICIQTAFRGFLARKALCALKGLVRLQAVINGRNAQNQSLKSRRSFQNFVRMQARIRSHRALTRKIGPMVPQTITIDMANSQPTETEEGWCDTIGTVEEIQARAQQRQEAAIKRERAMAYAFSNQWRANSKMNLESLFDYGLDNSTWSWIWLDRWTCSQPREGLSSNLQAVGDSGIVLKKSASVGIKKSAPKSSLDNPQGNHTRLLRTNSREAGSGLQFSPGHKSHSKRQHQKLNAEKWRSLSNPKQRPSKDVKRRESFPSVVRKVAHQGGANQGQEANGIAISEEGNADRMLP